MEWRFPTAFMLIGCSLATMMGSCQGKLSQPDNSDSVMATETVVTPVNTESEASGSESTDATATPQGTSDQPVPGNQAPARDYFKDGINRASSAFSIGQTAQSQDDWQLVANRWQQAISLMQQVSQDDANYATAQMKVEEYQRNLAVAQRQADGQPVTVRPLKASRPDGLIAQIPIVQRRGGTPVVPVTLHGQKGGRQFEMLFDTGATGTLITAEMAEAIGVVIVGETTATIADGSQVVLPIGYVDYIEAGGLRKESILVAIGGNVGLLGQDFYGAHRLSMSSQVIHLYE